MGLAHAKSFQPYHRVLNRNVWSGLEGARLLLRLLLALLAPVGPLVLGLDDTLERRRGAKIHAKGIDRDPVRSSRSHLVNASGLRWLSLMLLVPIPRAQRVWAVPFLTVLAPFRARPSGAGPAAQEAHRLGAANALGRAALAARAHAGRDHW
jgi:hypothetical protein